MIVKIKRYTLNVFIIFLFIYGINSCDFFAPYDLEFVELSDEKINFGLFENEKQFVIAYADSFNVSWAITTSDSWITVTPTSGIINIDDPDTVTVKIDREKIKGRGAFTAKIEISFHDKTNSKSIDIFAEIKAMLSISTDSLRFGASDTLSSFMIRNSGNYPLKWDFTPSNDWISAEPDTGIIAVDSSNYLSKSLNQNHSIENTNAEIKVRIDYNKLTSGNHSGLLQLKTEAGYDTIKVFVTKSSEPILSISANQLNFGKDETSKTITIDNLGGAELSWTAESNAPWITITPQSGSAEVHNKQISPKNNKSSNSQNINSAQLEIKVNRHGLTPGNYSSTVQINSNGGNASIEISMIVPEMPALAVSESVINFGNSETIKRVNVSNSGTGKLSWNVSTSETWITVFPLNDSTTTDKKEIIISVTRPGLLPGNYTGTINITSNGGNTALTVNMSVDEFPELNINPASLSFGTDKSSLSFDLKNSGGGKLEWKLTSSENWLLFEPSSGETTTETEQINVSVNRIGLNSGNYNGIINIESNAGNISIPVEMTVEEKPLLSYSPETINFGDQDSTANIEIRNIGNGNLNWQLSGNQPWISLNRANGNTPSNQKDDVEINISRNGLAPGDYNGELNISSNGGNGVITVTYSVKENPKLSFSPGAINLNDNDSTASFKIKNVGSGILNWQISTEDDWILLPITNGTTTKNNESEIEFNVNRDLLSPGDYSGNIDITSNGGNGSINVSIKIKDEPKITVSPKSLNFGDKDSSKTFEIKNTGTGNLTWQLSSNETWIKLSASDGITSSKDNDEIEVMVNSENLEPGDYEGSIKITSNAGEETVDVSMKVESKPNISVSAKNLDFDTGFNSLSFKISNKGTGTLEWEIETISDNWLSVNPGKGSITTGETAVFVNIDRNIMSPGNYNTKIDINSNGGKESVNIKVTVEEEPILSVTPTSIDFGSTLNSAILLLQNIGTGRLSWSSEIMYIDGDEGWLQMNQTSGNISSSRSINLSVNRSGLSNGSHTADIQIYSDGGNATIHLYLSVEEPHLRVSTNTLDFGTDLTELTFEVSNTGGGELVWEISTGAEDSWINVEPTSGSTTTENDIVTVNITRIGFDTSSGNFNKKSNNNGIGVNGHIYVTSGDFQETINVYVIYGTGDE